MPEQFMCKNSECVHESQRCDGKADCSDETDEFDCGGKASDNFWAVVLLLRQCFFNVQYVSGLPFILPRVYHRTVPLLLCCVLYYHPIVGHHFVF